MLAASPLWRNTRQNSPLLSKGGHGNLINMFRSPLTILLLLVLGTAWAQDVSYIDGELGERNPGLYAGPWRPEYRHDDYFGRLSFSDDDFATNYFYRFLWGDAPEYARFLSEDVSGAAVCPNDALARHAVEMRYGFRLLSISVLLEVMAATRDEAIRVRRPEYCPFDLPALLSSCRPQTQEMREFIKAFLPQRPYQALVLDKEHNFQSYAKGWGARLSDPKDSVSVLRIREQCLSEGRNCGQASAAQAEEWLRRSCEEDRAFLQTICSEQDELYGLSAVPQFAQLLSSSNLFVSYNTEGNGQGCLRRFGQLMSAKEQVPAYFSVVASAVTGNLRRDYRDRFLQGRAFVYGALKEFRDKGLGNLLEPKVVELPKKPDPVPVAVTPAPVVVTPTPKPTPTPVAVIEAPVVPAPKKPEVEEVPKTAFLQAAEVRQSQRLARVDVDMLKFRYDYVFSSAEMNLLAHSLKTYTTRQALEEMRDYDKLGSKDAAMPLTFLKYLIDSQNHQGLYNIVNVLGEKFWVTNDIDVKWKPGAEYAELRNDESTGRQWQIYVIQGDE